MRPISGVSILLSGLLVLRISPARPPTAGVLVRGDTIAYGGPAAADTIAADRTLNASRLQVTPDIVAPDAARGRPDAAFPPPGSRHAKRLGEGNADVGVKIWA